MHPDALRAALRERVARRVAGHGIERSEVERAVDAVVRALPADVTRSTGTKGEGDGAVSEVVLAIAAVSTPDLASRVRRALSDAGLAVVDTGSATSGRHTVVTVRIAGQDRTRAEEAARAAGWQISVVDQTG